MNNKFRIYTKGGDSGETSLVRGTRVSKSDPCLEAYGGMDELNSWLGLCIVHLEEIGLNDFEIQKNCLIEIQKDLFIFGSILACEEGQEDSLVQLRQSDVDKLERHIDEMDECLAPLKNFILPGGSLPGASLHLARSCCRRVERDVISLEKKLPPVFIAYINRLSDFLFIMARYVNAKSGSEEFLWKS